MPLVEYVGNATPQDNTEAVTLAPAKDGSAREIRRGRRALVSGNELRSLASHFQVRVVESTDETGLDEIPTEMPEGYDDEGYKPGESTSDIVYGPDTHSEDVETGATATPASASATVLAGSMSASADPSPAISVSPPSSSPRPASPPSSASSSGSSDPSA